MSRAAWLAAGLVWIAGGAHAARCETPHYRPRPLEAPVGPARIVGYNDMAEMVAGLDRAFEAAHPGVRFQTDLRGTRTGPPALAAGTSVLAPMGAPFSAEELDAYRRQTGADPLVFRIAHASLDPKALSGPLAIFVHPDNPLRQASLSAVARLFTDGGPHSWGELGLKDAWAARPIHLTGLAPQTALALELQARAFPGRPYAAGLELRQSEEVVRAVAEDPLALGFAALNRGEGRARPLALSPRAGVPAVAPTAAAVRAGRYPLDRHLLIYARQGVGGRLEPLAREYLALALSCEGQAIIASGSLGYLPLNARELKAERARLR